ncbi:MAG: 5-formyltetrahydrofolate cyclo-ligase [Burkholderiales bacterium]
MTSPSRTDIRRALRAARRGISPASRREAALAAARALATTGWLRPGRRLSGYLATAEEFDCAPLLEAARRHGMQLFVPQIAARRQPAMRFAPLTPPLRRNRYGLLEPASARTLAGAWMDVVLLPLVGFDAKGGRLGMGAGFYDRALSFRRRRSHWRGPRLIGVGFEVQRIEAIPMQTWDVHLDGVLTERGVTIFPERAE